MTASAGSFYNDGRGGGVRAPDGSVGAQAVTEFNETVTARRIVDVYANPSWGVSVRRDDVDATGSASVTSVDGELSLQCTAAANDAVVLETVDRAAYIPGNQGQVGIGVRIPTAATDDQAARWGLYSADNGFGFGQDASGVFVFTRSNGTETKVYQSNWNVDPMDGTGPSGITLDTTDGHIYEIDFVWYGYGSITWQILDGRGNKQQSNPVHVFNPTGSVSVEDPNQPIRVEVENGATGGAFDLRLGGRQFSLYRGARTAQLRDLHGIVYSVSLAASPTWTPMICARRKATVNGRTNSIRTHMAGTRILANANIETRIGYGDTVTGGSWGAPDGVSASETGIEVNTTMSGVTVGEVIHRGLLSSSTGSSRNAVQDEEFDDFPRDGALCYWARPFSGTPTVDAAIIDWQEEW